MMIRKLGESTWRAPAITAFDDERAIQTIIARSPDLLPGAAGSRTAVVSEMTVPAAGYVDIVGVGMDGEITLVECKLKANPDIRRHVVGQVFAYAAGLWGQTYDAFDQAFAARAGAPLATRVKEVASEDWDEEVFRGNVAANLVAGRFRLVLAVDEITDELGRIVQYLNEHTNSELQILALELKYVADSGVEILISNVYGKESVASKAKPPEHRRWDEASFFTTLAVCCTPAGLAAARRLYDFAKGYGATILWGTGPLASVTARLPVGGKPASLFSLYEWPKGMGTLAVNFEYLVGVAPNEALVRLADRLRVVPGVADRYVGLESADFKRRPSLSLDLIVAQPGAVEAIQLAVEELTAIGSVAT